MVWDQIPFNRERFGNTATSLVSLDDSVVRSQRRAREGARYVALAILRDQNHASIFAWSVANEPAPTPGGSETALLRQGDRDLVHKLDPTRLAAVDLAGYPSVQQSDHYAQFDAIGLNSYFGWYPGPSGELADRTGLRPFLRCSTTTTRTPRCSSPSSAPRQTATARSTRRAPTSSRTTSSTTTSTCTTGRTSTARSSGS